MINIAKIFLISPDSRLLLVLRDNNPQIPYPNHWSEIGGKIEANETPIEALKREIKEEISCEVRNIQHIGEMFDRKYDCRIILFKGRFSEKIENIKLCEGQKLGLFSPEEIKTLLMPHVLKKFIFNNIKKIF